MGTARPHRATLGGYGRRDRSRTGRARRARLVGPRKDRAARGGRTARRQLLERRHLVGACRALRREAVDRARLRRRALPPRRVCAEHVRSAARGRCARPSGLSVTEFAERVRAVVAALPKGDVVTYGEVAALAGKPG